jgi:hypothetical protein
VRQDPIFVATDVTLCDFDTLENDIREAAFGMAIVARLVVNERFAVSIGWSSTVGTMPTLPAQPAAHATSLTGSTALQRGSAFKRSIAVE